jgi:hypothetical protein
MKKTDCCCYICDKFMPQTVEFEHVIPISIGGQSVDTPRGLRIVCKTCHEWKSSNIDKNIGNIYKIKDINLLIEKIRKEHNKEDCVCGCLI